MCGLACLYLFYFLSQPPHRFPEKASIPCMYISQYNYLQNFAIFKTLLRKDQKS